MKKIMKIVVILLYLIQNTYLAVKMEIKKSHVREGKMNLN